MGLGRHMDRSQKGQSPSSGPEFDPMCIIAVGMLVVFVLCVMVCV